jgi:hypothetical protein
MFLLAFAPLREFLPGQFGGSRKYPRGLISTTDITDS